MGCALCGPLAGCEVLCRRCAVAFPDLAGRVAATITATSWDMGSRSKGDLLTTAAMASLLHVDRRHVPRLAAAAGVEPAEVVSRGDAPAAFRWWPEQVSVLEQAQVVRR